MIRLIQRRLIVPRGDTGTFSIPVLAGKDTGDASVFTIFNPLTHRKIFEKVMQLSDGVLTMDLSHGDTVNLPVGQFVWDIKFYSNPTIADGHIVDGEEVDSYYAAFTLPVCEIRETGDNLLFSDEAPQATLSPGQIDYITASINEVTSSKNAAAGSAAEADTSATNAGLSASAAAVSEAAAQDSQEAALASQQAAQTAAEQAIASAEAAAETAAQIEADLETKANVADLATVATSGEYSDLLHTPTNVSSFTNDAGYLTQHQDISMKANSADLATVATSGSYNDLENKPFIPSRVSDLTDDSGHYTKPVTGIPASDLEETYLTSFTETDPTVPSWAKATQKPTYTAQEVGAPTIQQMNTGLAAKTELFTVHFTSDYSVMESSESAQVTCDTSMADIIAAKNAGKIIYGELHLEDNESDTTATLSGIVSVTSYEMGEDNAYAAILIIDTGEGQDLLIYGQSFYNQEAWNLAIRNNINAFGNQPYYASGRRITTVGTPTQANDAATKSYVDNSTYAWAKAAAKPTYTAAEVGAPTTQEMNSAIATAIGNVHQFDVQVVQALPTQDIQEHTVYFVPKTGDTNDVYDEYIYVNNTWEMIGNTQIDLSNYATIPDMNKRAPAIYTIGASPITNAVSNMPFKSLILTIAGDPTDVGTSSASIIVGPSTTAAEGTTYTKLFDPIYEGTLDFVSGKLTITKAILDLGSIGYNYDDTHHYFYSQALYGIIDTNDPIYSSDMTVHTVEEIQSGEEGVAFGGATYIYVYDDEYVGMTIDEFKAAVAGKCVAYTLRTPRVIELGAAEIRTLEGTTYVMSDDGTVSVEYQVDTKSYIDQNEGTKDVRINGTSILSNGVANVPVMSTSEFGIAKIGPGLGISSSGALVISVVSDNGIKNPTSSYNNIALPITKQHQGVFYGLAKAAGDSTQSVSANAVGTYTNDAKTAIQNMLGVPSTSDLSLYATKADTVLNTTLSRGRKANTTIGTGSFAFGDNVQASGHYTVATGYNTKASGAFSSAGGRVTEASGWVSHADGLGTIANADNSYANGTFNVAFLLYSEWIANTSYQIGDKVIYDDEGYQCIEANADSEFDWNKWDSTKSNSDKMYVIGNGDAIARSNAYTLDWDGTGRFAGNIYVGCNNDSTGGTRLATVTEVAAKLDAAEAGMRVVRLI